MVAYQVLSLVLAQAVSYNPTNRNVQSNLFHNIHTADGRMNLQDASEDWDNITYWATGAAGTGTAPVVTKDACADPFGGDTAERVQISIGAGSTSGDYSWLGNASANSLTLGVQYVESLWIKTYDGTSKSVILRDDTGINTQSVIAVNGTYQRASITAAAVVAGATFKIWLRGGTGSSSSADLCVWGGQLEVGSTPGAYVKTTTQARPCKIGTGVRCLG